MTTPASLAAVQVADTDLLQRGGENSSDNEAILQLCDEVRELRYAEII